jgi:hypothetical protein
MPILLALHSLKSPIPTSVVDLLAYECMDRQGYLEQAGVSVADLGTDPSHRQTTV